jgi:hypothetical protein
MGPPGSTPVTSWWPSLDDEGAVDQDVPDTVQEPGEYQHDSVRCARGVPAML